MAHDDLQRAIQRVSQAVVGVFDVQILLERVVDACQEIFEAEACSLFVVNLGRDALTMIAARGYSAQFIGRPAPLRHRDHVIEHPTRSEDKLGITGWIASTGRPFVSNTPSDHRAHPHWTGKYDIQQFGPEKKVHNFFGIPLKITEDDVIGVLKVEGKRREGEYIPFSETDADLFDILAAHIAVAMADAGG